VNQHRKWNENYVDATNFPLTNPVQDDSNSGFRTAITEYLPTPPASDASEHGGDDVVADKKPSENRAARVNDAVAVRYASPTPTRVYKPQPSFRRRVGRGGRISIDRRSLSGSPGFTESEKINDRWRYDHDDDNDDNPLEVFVDSFGIKNMHYRATNVSGPSQSQQAMAARRAQIAAAAQSSTTATSSSTGQVAARVPAAEGS
jgi:enhancer of polycomb-like protein